MTAHQDPSWDNFSKHQTHSRTHIQSNLTVLQDHYNTIQPLQFTAVNESLSKQSTNVLFGEKSTKSMLIEQNEKSTELNIPCCWIYPLEEDFCKKKPPRHFCETHRDFCDNPSRGFSWKLLVVFTKSIDFHRKSYDFHENTQWIFLQNPLRNFCKKTYEIFA